MVMAANNDNQRQVPKYDKIADIILYEHMYAKY